MLLPLTKLLEGRDQPLCVAGDLDIQSALARMIEHDYSQLPVIDDRDDSGMVAASVEQAEREYALDYASGESAIGFLKFYFEQLDETATAVRIDFATMNEMYPESPLPPAASAHSSWWTNDPGQPQAHAWLDAGWEVDHVTPIAGEVAMRRIIQTDSDRSE